MRIVISDDVVAARRETFELPGLDVQVYAHADDALAIIAAISPPPDLVCMDYAMGAGHRDGEEVIRDLRTAGFRGRILATSSDPQANERMRAAGADDALVGGKALLRSYLVHLATGAP
jgi:CheY-like chemotaxis protein